jgi:U3 small nucleolar ribonucleoprotein protein LCP5
VLEKVKLLENKIEKLTCNSSDPLSFRPNPQNLTNVDDGGSADEHSDVAHDSNNRNDIYRPPRVAAMPYVGGPTDKKLRHKPVPSALAALMYQDPTRPHVESASGLGAIPSLSANRTREIQRMTEFEEENFTRLVMKKKDMKRRMRDEEDIALGGSGGIAGIRRGGGGLEDEFGDVLKSVGRSRVGATGDGYEELRKKGNRGSILARSRTRTQDEAFPNPGDEVPRLRKRSRFEMATKVSKKKLQKSR